MEVGMRPEINPFSRLKTLREEKADISFGRLPARLLFSVVMRNKQDEEMSGKKTEVEYSQEFNIEESFPYDSVLTKNYFRNFSCCTTDTTPSTLM